MYLIIIRLERGQFMAVLLFNTRSPSLFEYYTTTLWFACVHHLTLDSPLQKLSSTSTDFASRVKNLISNSPLIKRRRSMSLHSAPLSSELAPLITMIPRAIQWWLDVFNPIQYTNLGLSCGKLEDLRGDPFYQRWLVHP